MRFTSQTIYLDGREISANALAEDPDFSSDIDRLNQYISDLDSAPNHPDLPFIRALPEGKALTAMERQSKAWKQNYSNLVVMGTGGSSIGGQALCSILKYKSIPPSEQMKVKFLDNLGHHQLEHLFDDMDLAETCFLIISKSGSTIETLAQCLVAMDAVRDATKNPDIGTQFTAIVQLGDSPLRRLAEAKQFHIVDHIEELGGRFSALSVVGLLPAISRGFEASMATDAARSFYEIQLNPKLLPQDNAPMLGAVVQACLAAKGFTQSVFMPYESRLINLSRWYQQLWAESLGKDEKGTTPVRALGPLDQHSQLQLFLDGPRDKFFTFLLGNAVNVGFRLDKKECKKLGLDYLSDKTIGDLVHAEANASIAAMIQKGIPVRVLRYEVLDEDFIGELMAFFILETLFMAKLLDVNPFDQPAVERGKELTRRFLSHRPDQL